MVFEPLVFPLFCCSCDNEVPSVSLPELNLLTKYPCPLCEEAKLELAPYLHQVKFVETDITLPENQHLYKLYRYDIPVFYYQGEFLMKHKVDLPLFLQKLQQWGK